MIAYDLQCSNGHTFEGWFEDEAGYKKQQEKSLVACPICNSMSVHRIPSTFSIKTSPSTPNISQSVSKPENFEKQLLDYVKNHFDDVGADFAKEALKIHYGASEPRNIRGISTKQEEKILKQEGVSFFKIPAPANTDTDA